MAELLLTLHCAPDDAEAVLAALQAHVAAPIQLREEAVRGRDYQDASIAEQVSGLLRRVALSLPVDEERLPLLVQAAASARRRAPLRWRATPILAQGRIE